MSAVAEMSWVSRVEEAVLSQLSDSGFSQMFQDGRAKALAYARSLGFEPLAVLPTEVWNQICRRFELYRFKMRYGQTYSRMFYPEWLIPVAILSVFAAFLATLTFGVLMVVNQDSFLLISAVLAVVAFVSVVLIAVLRYFGQLVFLCLPKGFLLRKFWPNLVSEPKDPILIPVSFNTDELFRDKEITLRKKGVGYWIASMPEAIQLQRAFTADKMLEACPVLYLEDNNCAIILAQCGEFPKEKEAVELARQLAGGVFNLN